MGIEKKFRLNLFELKSDPVRRQFLDSIETDEIPTEEHELPNGEVHLKIEYGRGTYIIIEQKHIGQTSLGDLYEITLRELNAVEKAAREIIERESCEENNWDDAFYWW